MSSGSKSIWPPLITLIVIASVLGTMDYEMVRADTKTQVRTLRVCADPNNLPFSNERREGFENAIARLVANTLGRKLEYTWWPQRRGFVRHTVREDRCDLVMGVPEHYDLLATTRPYYASSYVFVTQRKRHLKLQSLDDPRLKQLQIGVHTIGDDYANVPPVEALAARGIIDNVHGYPIYGAYSQPDPPRNLLDALAKGEIDVAIAWGPLAGYFATRESQALEVHVIEAAAQDIPMRFAISMGVRRGDDALKADVQRVISRHATDIAAILDRYGVPRVRMKESKT